jgi:hypothetical protein
MHQQLGACQDHNHIKNQQLENYLWISPAFSHRVISNWNMPSGAFPAKVYPGRRGSTICEIACGTWHGNEESTQTGVQVPEVCRRMEKVPR